jgi:hypothetical protein
VGVVQMSSTSSRNAVTSCTIFAMPISSVEIDVYAGRTCRCCVQNHDRLFVNDTCSDLSAINSLFAARFPTTNTVKTDVENCRSRSYSMFAYALAREKNAIPSRLVELVYTCNHGELPPHTCPTHLRKSSERHLT